MYTKYDDMTIREKNIYTIGFIKGLCYGCEKRSKHDDYDKLPGRQKYCLKCKKKEVIDFSLNARDIDLT